MSDFLDDFPDGNVPQPEGVGSLLGLDPHALSGEQFKVLTARGTEDGLILRIDGRAEWSEILSELERFLGSRRKFFAGGEVALEWLERLPTREQGKDLEVLLRDHYGLQIKTRRRRPQPETSSDRELSAQSEKSGEKGGITIPLFEQFGAEKDLEKEVERLVSAETSKTSAGKTDAEKVAGRSDKGSRTAEPAPTKSRSAQIGGKSMASSYSSGDSGNSESGSSVSSIGRRYAQHAARMLGDELYYEDDANAKVVFGTLRSGQRVETPFSLVIIGDVNPGADLIAGGDIIVLGSLRGTAHASAYDDDCHDRVIVALHMQPMQLRIGSVISRGSDEVVRGVEIARIENRRIIVEHFNSRAMLGKKFR